MENLEKLEQNSNEIYSIIEKKEKKHFVKKLLLLFTKILFHTRFFYRSLKFQSFHKIQKLE